MSNSKNKLVESFDDFVNESNKKVDEKYLRDDYFHTYIISWLEKGIEEWDDYVGLAHDDGTPNKDILAVKKKIIKYIEKKFEV